MYTKLSLSFAESRSMAESSLCAKPKLVGLRWACFHCAQSPKSKFGIKPKVLDRLIMNCAERFVLTVNKVHLVQSRSWAESLLCTKPKVLSWAVSILCRKHAKVQAWLVFILHTAKIV